MSPNAAFPPVDGATSSPERAAERYEPLCRFAWYERGTIRDHKTGDRKQVAAAELANRPRWQARLHTLSCGAMIVSAVIDGWLWNGRFTPTKADKPIGPLILYRSNRKA